MHIMVSSLIPVGCTGSSGTTAHGAATASGAATPAGVVLDCLLPLASCYAPHVFQVADGIQPLLNRGIDGRGETVTVLQPGPYPVTGAHISETTWNGQSGLSQAPGASGGAFSHLYARPAYQHGVPGIGAMRGVPDVAADADQQGGSPVVLTSGGKTWITSARSSSYHDAFHDITTGSNIQTMPYPGGTDGYPAGPGWDPVTGRGSPGAQFSSPCWPA